MSAISTWSTTAASNNSAAPNGWPEGQTIASLNDTGREMMSALRYELAAQDTIASATTTDIGAKQAHSLTVSGTTSITGLGTISAGIKKNLTFSGSLTLTHNATSLILPSGANIVTAAGDTCEVESLGSGNWRCNWYTRASLVFDNASKEVIAVEITSPDTTLTTGTSKKVFRMPFAMTVTSVRASLSTASSSGTPTFDINDSGTTILSTKLTIDANEKTSTSAATPAVISDSALGDDAEISIDVDVAGTGAKGAVVYIIGTRA